jgi:hypothetical protein
VIKSDNYTDIKESEIEINSDMLVYPNPAGDYIYINYGNYTLKGVVDDKSFLRMQESALRIYNVLGECVLTVETQNFVSLPRIDVSSLPSGVYFLKINQEVSKFTKY